MDATSRVGVGVGFVVGVVDAICSMLLSDRCDGCCSNLEVKPIINIGASYVQTEPNLWQVVIFGFA